MSQKFHWAQNSYFNYWKKWQCPQVSAVDTFIPKLEQQMFGSHSNIRWIKITKNCAIMATSQLKKQDQLYKWKQTMKLTIFSVSSLSPFSCFVSKYPFFPFRLLVPSLFHIKSQARCAHIISFNRWTRYLCSSWFLANGFDSMKW